MRRVGSRYQGPCQGNCVGFFSSSEVTRSTACFDSYLFLTAITVKILCNIHEFLYSNHVIDSGALWLWELKLHEVAMIRYGGMGTRHTTPWLQAVIYIQLTTPLGVE